MKKYLFVSISALATIVVLAFCLPQKQDQPVSKIREQYNRNCASCHGMQLDRFAGHHWVFGGSKNEIASTIKNGRPSIGMPGFSKALNDNEIDEMAAFVIAELPNRDFLTDKAKIFDSTVFTSGNLKFKLQKIVEVESVAWGLAFLPNGDMLVTDKSGILFRVNKEGKKRIEGVPEVMVQGQGGLLDVAVHPNFSQNSLIYLSFSERGGNEGGNTSIVMARLADDKLYDVKKIFHALPNSTTGLHFGGRIVFDNNGYIFFSVGERGNRVNAQDLSNHSGKIHRLHDDGRIPGDNPFVGKENVQTSIWSYGHRNPQSLYFDKETGTLWENEHGPKGGDELNLIQKGKNFGWPVITFGIDYDGTIISSDTAKAGLEQPIYYWIPSIAPCGMTRVKGNKYKEWEGSFLIGSLSFRYLERILVNNKKMVVREKLLPNIGRVRNVVQSPEGYIYISVEDPGRIYKVVPL